MILKKSDKCVKRLEKLDAPEEVKAELRRQVNRLERTSPESMEASVTRNYLEWVFGMPWNIFSVDNDIEHAKNVLNEDHFGLKEIKDRILDFISIRKLKTDGYAPNSIELAWDPAGESAVKGYRVYRAPANGAFGPIADTGAVPTYSDHTAEHGKTYRYAVVLLFFSIIVFFQK